MVSSPRGSPEKAIKCRVAFERRQRGNYIPYRVRKKHASALRNQGETLTLPLTRHAELIWLSLLPICPPFPPCDCSEIMLSIPA